jgi:hypothetical protein
MSYIGNEPIVSATRTVTEVTATAGQTVFNANGGYTVGYLDVFLNGAQLQNTDFTATNGSSVTLTEAAQVNDVVRLVAWGTFSTSNLVSPNYTGTLTGGTDVVNIGSGQLYKDASGNVGIGTSSFAIANRLNVKQSADNSAAGLGLRVERNANDSSVFLGYRDNTDTWQINATYLTTGAFKPLSFHTADTERMRIDSSGNLLVGVTAYTYSSTADSFQVGAGSNAGVISRNSTATRQLFVFNNPNGAVGAINISGSSTSFVTSSDYRLKEDITPMTGALERVAQLKPVTYKWKVDGSAGEGFIAHELAEVVPDCVTGEKDAVDAEGKPQYQGIDTSFLVATLTAAIQEQQAQLTDMSLTLANANAIIQSQADTITAMEARLTALEGINNDKG